MNKKSFSISTELWAGTGLIAAGVLALATGHHEAIAEALAPFGIGVILFDFLTRFGKATRETVRVLIRKDDK